MYIIINYVVKELNKLHFYLNFRERVIFKATRRSSYALAIDLHNGIVVVVDNYLRHRFNRFYLKNHTNI